MTWKYFNGNCDDRPHPLTKPPERPPWREFLANEAVDAETDKEYWNNQQFQIQTVSMVIQNLQKQSWMDSMF